MAELVQRSLDDIDYKQLLVRVHDASDTDLIDRIAYDLKNAAEVLAGRVTVILEY